jgi:hypothetical protein
MSRRRAAARPFPSVSYRVALGALLLSIGTAARAQDCLAELGTDVVRAQE